MKKDDKTNVAPKLIKQVNWEREKVLTKLQRKKYLSYIANNAEKDSDKLRAIETLSKICGDYQPSKQDLKANVTFNITKDDLDI